MMQNDQLLEYAEYVGNYYGTPRDFVEKTLESGNDIILEIEVQGALQVKQKFPEGYLFSCCRLLWTNSRTGSSGAVRRTRRRSTTA